MKRMINKAKRIAAREVLCMVLGLVIGFLIIASMAEGQVTITGPTEARQNESVPFEVTGLDAADYEKKVTLCIRPPEGVTPDPQSRIRDGQLVLWIKAEQPGEYWFAFAVDNEDGPPELILFDLTVGNPGPEPNPDPTPDPIPHDTKWQIVIVHESDRDDNLPADQQSIIKSLVFRKQLTDAGHKIPIGGVVDIDREVPPSLAPYLVECKGKTLPRICLSALEGGKIWTFPLPANERAVMILLEGAKP